jgi:RNA polymerase sigma-70 factor (ECF subfamily)
VNGPLPRSEAEETPDDLVPAAIAGDAEAVARIFRLEHGAVWRLCLGLLADRAEADDAAQDAMLHLLDHLDRWDRRRPWTAWRNTLVLNHCRDRLRRAAARRRAESEAAERALPQVLPHPHSDAERSEVNEIVAASLRSLTPREREVFVLHDLEGSATSDVAAALALAERAVRVLLAAARRRLRELLAPRLAGIAPSTSEPGAPR